MRRTANADEEPSCFKNLALPGSTVYQPDGSQVVIANTSVFVSSSIFSVRGDSLKHTLSAYLIERIHSTIVFFLA